ncbi:cytochrome P450 [Lentzea sp. NBRC 105346]|uniref:cytochrome P450 n=1 Tax=Lentzea sp. NBRC 105346 TaxID=3032205 RepID=UPI0024A215F8|nr:cytochrome P450 [Lentzea sp. NBRC 105346]GLZ29004.1 cytochrome P450 [Lentzea sp. NBRC 105346]
MPNTEPANGCPARGGGSEHPASDEVLGFPFAPAGSPLSLPPIYDELRRERPVCRVRLPTGAHAWLVTTWADARFVLSDPRFSKAAMTRPDAPKARPGELPRGVLFTTDPPEHTRLRALLSRALTTRRILSLRPRMVAYADHLIERMTPPADLVSSFAAPLAMRATCDLLGVPVSDQEQFAAWSETVLAVDGRSSGDVERAQRELFAYIGGLVETRTGNPGNDLVSDLLRHASPEPVVGLVATLLVTGYETMAAGVTNSVLTLLAAHGKLLPDLDSDALEELFRFAAFGDALRSRRALRDVRVGPVLVRAGDLVMVSTASANRDPSVFGDADMFLPTRCPNPHVAFGRGVHYCAGASLARTQLRIALSRLAYRLPGLSLATPLADITLRPGGSESPPERLLVRW